ncbi:pyruvate dehydrogenase (acetyl-transferring) E1 component subunit alpha [Candidatus Woesearchaeota archaeon]|nr:pyruvate dehydrogenase (acetyl-transferring) E1 component subunit alpha [Candidatus Woesearchaeota archaeon]
MKKVLERFQVEYLQILNENGNCDKKLMPSLTKKQIKEMYEYMVLTRVFDDKALKLQRQGRLGTYAPTRGQEASQIGSVFAVQDDDMVFPAFRENGVYLARKMPMELLFQFWAGDERGMNIPKNVNMFPVAITVGAQPLHAVGYAIALKYKKMKAAAVTYFGDGATSEGDFHEAMNFAGVYKAPCVFICQNNQYAISVPVEEQTASRTLAQKAIAYGFDGIKVDGNDPFAVYKATYDALRKARSGKGPTLIECFTYRIGDHTTSDDAKKYRKEKEVKEWEKKDPILRLKKYMKKAGMFSERYENEVKKIAEGLVEKAVAKAESIQRLKPEEIFNYTYASLTEELKEQKEQIKLENFTIAEKKKSAGKNTSVVGELEEA